MTTLLDTLLIKIDGDSRGIQSVIKQAISTSVGAVNEINKQEVDWTSIFTRAVSPAIIAGIASTFAFAIDQSLQFQQAMNQTGAAAGDSATQIAQIGSSALNLSTVVPASAQDIATAMAQVGTVFGQGSQATTDLVKQMEELAYTTGDTLPNTVSTALSLFKQFGITTQSSGTQALTDLLHAAQAVDEPVSQIGNAFNTVTQNLPAADKTLQSLNGDLSAFAGLAQTIGTSGASTIFGTLVSSAGNAGGQVEQLGIGFGTVEKALQTGNITGLIQEVVGALQTIPSTGAIAIIGPQAYSQFTTVAADMPAFLANTKSAATSASTIDSAYQDALSTLTKIQLFWNTLVADAIKLGNEVLPPIESMFSSIGGDAESLAGDFGNIVKDLTGSSITGALSEALSIFKEIVQAATVFVDGLTSGVDLATEIATLLKDVATFNWGAVSKDIQAILTPTAAMQRTVTDGLGLVAQTANLFASTMGGTGDSSSQNSSGVKNNNTTINNVWNVTPSGNSTAQAQNISKTLYEQFQGLQ